MGRLMTARWMEEGTEPDAVGTTVNVLGVRVFSWVNFIHRTARNVSRYQVPGRRALQPRPRSERSTYYNTSKCGASTEPGNLGMRGFVLRTVRIAGVARFSERVLSHLTLECTWSARRTAHGSCLRSANAGCTCEWWTWPLYLLTVILCI